MSYPIRLLNRPLALLPSYANTLSAMLPDKVNPADKMCELVQEIAVIPVRGVLTNSYWDYGGTTYNELTANLLEAFSDDGVVAIVLYVDSPGGEVTGCAEVVDLIYTNRSTKPTIAIVDGMACSAAYWIASACQMITVAKHGVSGNVGAIVLHADITESLAKAGVKITTIQYGAYKSEGYPTTPMTKGAIGRVQADVDAIGEAFVKSVARNRGLTAASVRGTEAQALLGSAGLKAGFVDVISSPTLAFNNTIEAMPQQSPRRAAAAKIGPYARHVRRIAQS